MSAAGDHLLRVIEDHKNIIYDYDIEKAMEALKKILDDRKQFRETLAMSQLLKEK